MENSKVKSQDPKLAGFTLAEILIALVISTILMAMLATTLIQTQAVYSLTDISADLNANSRLAINKMSAELRRTSTSQVTISKNSPFSGTDRITYRTPLLNASGEPLLSGLNLVWSNDTEITVDPINRNRLIKTRDGASAVLAQNVTSVRFIDMAQSPATIDQDELKIYLTMNKRGYRQNVTVTTVSTVDMRN